MDGHIGAIYLAWVNCYRYANSTAKSGAWCLALRAFLPNERAIRLDRRILPSRGEWRYGLPILCQCRRPDGQNFGRLRNRRGQHCHQHAQWHLQQSFQRGLERCRDQPRFPDGLSRHGRRQLCHHRSFGPSIPCCCRFCRPRPRRGRGLESIGVRLFPNGRNVPERQHADRSVLVRAQHRDQCPSRGWALAHHASHHDRQHFWNTQLPGFSHGRRGQSSAHHQQLRRCGHLPDGRSARLHRLCSVQLRRKRQHGRRLMPVLWVRRPFRGLGIHLDRGAQ